MAGAGKQSFEAVLYELPSNYAHISNVAMDVPKRVSEAFGQRGYVPIVGTVNGCTLAATLVPVGEGRHRLFLNGDIRTAIGKGSGDSVQVRVRFDPHDRTPEMPPDLEMALRNSDALAAWKTLNPSRRKECLVVLADAKRLTTREKRIAGIVRVALDEGLPRLE